HTIPPKGSLVTANDGSLTSGIFNTYNGSALSAGDHYLIVERFFDDDSIRVWQPLGDDTPIKLNRQLIDTGAILHCYGFAENTIFEVPVQVDSQYVAFTWNRDHNSKKVSRYVVTAGPLYLTSPEINEPASWATIALANLVFRWNDVQGASTYQIQISLDASFEQIVIGQAALTQTQFSPNGLDAGTTYFWRVRAVNPSHTSPWSPVRRVRTEGINIADRQVAYYPLDGSPADSVGVSDGTLMGDVTLAGDRFGNAERSYSFDGDGDYITFPESEAFTSIDKQITVSCWIYPMSVKFEAGLMIRDRFWRLMLDGDGSVFGNIFNESDEEDRVASTDKTPLETWTFVAFTYDGQTIKVYVDGEPSGELEYPTARIGVEGTSSIPTLGKGIGLTQEYFDGLIDEVRIYDRALSADEMAELYRFTPTAVAELDEGSIPTEYLLNQNYPNPFNPSTTISYQLPESGHVRLSIFNIAGQLVETLVDDKKKAGYHSVIWQAHGVASGLYFFRIVAGGFHAVKKCVVMK
ncbi:MAG: LamG-like jellyroll fold domain-containing protein, partial [bacterium]